MPTGPTYPFPPWSRFPSPPCIDGSISSRPRTSWCAFRPYAVNRTKRLIKAPKIFWSDTGLALHLSQQPEPQGAHLENIVLHDLLAWREGRRDRPEISYWRTATGEEVDLVVEAGNRLLPIEVKAGSRPRLADAANLRSFRAEYGKRAHAGLLLHTGARTEWLAPDVLAVPWWRVV